MINFNFIRFVTLDLNWVFPFEFYKVWESNCLWGLIDFCWGGEDKQFESLWTLFLSLFVKIKFGKNKLFEHFLVGGSKNLKLFQGGSFYWGGGCQKSLCQFPPPIFDNIFSLSYLFDIILLSHYVHLNRCIDKSIKS